MDVFTIPSWFLPAAFILFLFNIFLYALRSTGSWSTMGMGTLPPTPPKLPIIGNLHQLLGKHQHQALWQLSQTYGPLMLLHFGSKPYLIVSSSAVANEILKTHDRFFCTRPVYQGTKRLTYNYLDIAFSPYDNHWKEMRKVFVSELLGQKRAGLFNAVTEKEIEGLVRSLSLLPSGTVVNLDEKLLALVFGVNCKVAFGKSYREEPFRGESLKDMLDEAKNMLGGSTGDHFPIIGRILDKLSGWTGRLDKCFSNLDGYVQMVLDEHLNHAGAEISEHEKDFVHALIDLSSKENTTRLTKEDIKALIMDVLTGGTDTIVVTMVWAMSEIARNPRVMQKLQSEIRSCIGRKLKVDRLDTSQMAYLKMVVKETLRLHPPAPLLLPRECLSHCQIGGYDVFPETRVLINAWGIGRDGDTWGHNPTEFYPERLENLEFDFGGENFDMVPFGGGRRSCPAFNSATTTIELTIANLLYWFDWEVPDGLKNEDLNMEEAGSLVVYRKSSLCLMPKKHGWQD